MVASEKLLVAVSSSYADGRSTWAETEGGTGEEGALRDLLGKTRRLVIGQMVRLYSYGA